MIQLFEIKKKVKQMKNTDKELHRNIKKKQRRNLKTIQHKRRRTNTKRIRKKI